jgi:hypothetical protein
MALWFSFKRTPTKPQPQPTMYTPDNEKNISKEHSRFKVARSIKADGNHNKVIHYLGGVSTETDFEQFFSKQNSTFIRYERTPCNLPKDYCQAWKFVLSPSDSKHTFHTELNQKNPDQYGYFVNKDFFTESQKFMQLPEIISQKNYFWLDFCGMPSDSLIGQVNDFVKSYNDFVEEIYLTFFLNPRAMDDVAKAVNRYGNSLKDRAKSVCDTLKEKLSIDNFSFSIVDVYVNGRSPMAVIKMKKKMKKQKQTKTASILKLDSKSYAVWRDGGITNRELEKMYGMSRQAIAAFQAWNTMRGKTWNLTDEQLLEKRKETFAAIEKFCEQYK